MALALYWEDFFTWGEREGELLFLPMRVTTGTGVTLVRRYERGTVWYIVGTYP